jgi:hypothetical protein
MKNTIKNFYIVRYFIDNKCVKGTKITKKEALNMMSSGIYPTDTTENNAGGFTLWFDLDISIRKK